MHIQTVKYIRPLDGEALKAQAMNLAKAESLYYIIKSCKVPSALCAHALSTPAMAGDHPRNQLGYERVRGRQAV